MGFKVIVSDGNSNAPGFEYADDHYVASTYDISDTLNAVKKYQRRNKSIDGIISVASDVPLTVATIAENFNLPSISVETARICSNKLIMKEHFLKKKIPIPWFKEIHSIKELKSVIKDRGNSLVLKPIDSRGSRGVLRLIKNIDINWAFNYSKKLSSLSKIMVEEFEQGPQYSTESICTKNKIYTPGFSDRYYPFLKKFAPFIIENGGELPSSVSFNNKKRIT